jgi:ATP synthase protein I
VSDTLPPDKEKVVDAVKRRAERDREARRVPSVARNLGQIGVLGWQIVVPTLIGLAIGRWIDHHFRSGVFFTASLLMAGLVVGCWSAWRWMQRQ